MGRLYFSLDEIPLDQSNTHYLSMLSKFFQSNKNLDYVHESVRNYDLSKLSDKQLRIFVELARRKFVFGKEQKDVSWLPEVEHIDVFSLKD